MEAGNYMIFKIFILDELNLIVNVFVIDLQPEVDKVQVFLIDHFKNLGRFCCDAERLAVRRMHKGIDKDIQAFPEIINLGPAGNVLFEQRVKAIMSLGKSPVIDIDNTAKVIGQAGNHSHVAVRNRLAFGLRGLLFIDVFKSHDDVVVGIGSLCGLQTVKHRLSVNQETERYRHRPIVFQGVQQIVFTNKIPDRTPVVTNNNLF